MRHITRLVGHGRNRLLHGTRRTVLVDWLRFKACLAVPHGAVLSAFHHPMVQISWDLVARFSSRSAEPSSLKVSQVMRHQIRWMWLHELPIAILTCPPPSSAPSPSAHPPRYSYPPSSSSLPASSCPSPLPARPHLRHPCPKPTV